MTINSLYLLFGILSIFALFSTNLSYVDAIQAEDKLCSEIKSDSKNSTFSSIAYFHSPLIQITHGVDPSNVTCTEEKALVLKQSNGLPACVNPSSIEKLIMSGWAIHVLPDYVVENNNSEIFSLGGHLITSEMVTLIILRDTWQNLQLMEITLGL